MTHPFRSHPAAALTAAAALALAAPAAARTVGDWEVESSAKSCTMLSTFEGDVSIGLLAPKNGALSFLAGGEGMAALVRPGQKVSLNLKFAGKVPHDDWTDDAAVAATGPDGQAVVIADWGPSYAKELADAVTSSGTVTVSVAGKTLGTYDLSGSPVAYRELSRCGSQLASK